MNDKDYSFKADASPIPGCFGYPHCANRKNETCNSCLSRDKCTEECRSVLVGLVEAGMDEHLAARMMIVISGYSSPFAAENKKPRVMVKASIRKKENPFKKGSTSYHVVNILLAEGGIGLTSAIETVFETTNPPMKKAKIKQKVTLVISSLVKRGVIEQTTKSPIYYKDIT